MAKPVHILIIGGGLIGLATARAFISRGAKVTLAERKPATGCGAGFANSGMLHPSQVWPWVSAGLNKEAQLSAAATLLPLAKSSTQLIKARLKALSLPDKNRSSGCLQIFETNTHRAAAIKRYDALDITTEATECLSRPALKFTHDFSANALSWSRAETAALLQEGAKIHINAKINLTHNGTHLIARLNESDIKADHIILCTGHETNRLLNPLGFSLPLQSVRGFALDFNTSQIDLNRLPLIPIMEAQSRSALTQFGNVLRLSGTLGENSARPLWQKWCEIIPHIMQSLPAPHHVWSGERPISQLGRPVICETPLSRLWVNTGHGHMGWTLSMGSGELMADMVLQGKSCEAFAWPKD